MSAALDDVTVSLNDGPRVPLAHLQAALDTVRKRPKRQPGQTDLEDDALGGRDPGNEAKAAGIAVDRLRSLVERIERLNDERKALGEDIKDIYAEAKSAGFDVPVLRDLIRVRKKAAAEVDLHLETLDLYRTALGK